MKKVLFSFFAAALSFGATAQTLIYHGTFNGNANDLSGNAHHGTTFGSPTYAAGFTGTANTAIYLDGVDDRVQLPAHANFNLSTWTLQAFIKPASHNSATCQASSLIWHGAQFSNQHYRLAICDNWYDLSCTTNGIQEAFDAQATGTSATPDFQTPWYGTNGHVTLNRWYCVTATFGPNAVGTPTLNLYVDGTLIETGTWTGPAYDHTGANATPQNTHIGWSPQAGYPYWFNGTIDQVSIWNGVMAAATIDGFCDKTEGNTWKQSNPDNGNGDINNVNIMAIANNEIKISPIPTDNEITVNVSEYWKGGKMTILNGVGQVLSEVTVDGTHHTINVRELPIGIYMLKTTKGNESRIDKFIKN